MSPNEEDDIGKKEAKGLSRIDAWRSERNARVSAIISQLVHDIRQPLAAILANAQTALLTLEKDKCDLGEVREILTDIVLDEKRAWAMIQDINDSLQRQKGCRGTVNLAKTVSEVLDLLHREIVGEGIQIKYLPEEEFCIQADEQQIRQALIELITNAIEAMQAQPAQRRRLELTLEPVARDRVQVTVSDSGPGIQESDLPTLFDPFRTAKSNAPGIGLFLCRSIVQAHGGSIRLQRSPYGGASFCVTLPLRNNRSLEKQEIQLVSPEQRATLPEKPVERPAKTRVLLVDDSEPYRHTTWSMMASLAFLELVGEAEDGLDAIQKARDLKPGLILMDVRLAGINGIEAAAKIREFAPATKILFLSQYDDPDVVSAVLHTGALGYILKVDTAKDLIPALTAISNGEIFLSSGVRH